MSLSIGIVGLPNVGKSTIFNILTKNNILAANYPFATIEPNTGIVPVPDQRLEKLRQIYNAQKIIPATVEFVDIAGLVAGASKGEGLGNKFLANIRECDAIAHIVRAFEDNDVIRVDQNSNPKKDIEVINTELILADLNSIENKIMRLHKDAKSDPKAKVKLNYLEKLKTELEQGIINYPESEIEIEATKELNLLSYKPTIYVFNVDENNLSNNDFKEELINLVAPNKAIFIGAKLENELKDLDEADAKELLDSYGIEQSGLDQLITSAYDILGLQSYLTAGEKEIRAWTIKKGFTAPQAAGVIHTDFERGFIAAQIMDYNDLIELGSEAKVKEAGKMRTEGKTYIMQPNDIVEFRFNV